MTPRWMKYNPAFLSSEEQVANFAARQSELEAILEIIRENNTDSIQHVLVLGPRGSGKTTLALRVAAELERDQDLSRCWIPVVLPEESYQVGSAGELWLEALRHLGTGQDEARWERTYEELRAIGDASTLRERALTRLLGFGEEQNKRLLLIVENLHMLLEDQMTKDEAWNLRHTLQNSSRLMLLATATARFGAIDDEGQAFYGLFRRFTLEPLDLEDCCRLWTKRTGVQLSDDRLRPLQILSGGNPRLLAIRSTFAAKVSLRDLMEDLMRLVDDHTEYFKSHLDSLAPKERRVYLALVELWDPSGAREVASAARTGVNETSSLLKRLMSRGAVTEVESRRRTKRYQVSERLFNVYYLMRRHGAASDRVRAVVEFMVGLYEPQELVSLSRTLAVEAQRLAGPERQDHFLVFEGLLRRAPQGCLREDLLSTMPRELLAAPDVPGTLLSAMHECVRETMSESPPDRMCALITRARQLLESRPSPEQVEEVRGQIRAESREDPAMWCLLGDLLDRLEPRQPDEAVKSYARVIERIPDCPTAWSKLARVLERDLKRISEAEHAYRRAVELRADQTWPASRLFELLLRQPERRVEAVTFAENWLVANGARGEFLNSCARGIYASAPAALLPQAERWSRKAVELVPTEGNYRRTLAWILARQGRLAEALDETRECLAHPETLERTTSGAIHLLVELAARGCSRDALAILTASPSAARLEPLAVGLRLDLGEPCWSASEIFEVGQDVLQRIRKRRSELASQPQLVEATESAASSQPE